MIKTFIKKRIRKTGMYQILEKENKKIKIKINSLEQEKLRVTEDNLRTLKEKEEEINSLEQEKLKLADDNLRMLKGKELEINLLRQEKLKLSEDNLRMLKEKELEINLLEKQKQEYLVERSSITGFSLKNNLRGISTDAGKANILKYILENIKKDAKILDVGFGSGVYGKLLRSFYYQNIDGLDVYGENIKEMGLDLIYNNIFIENILDFDFDFYDLIIMGDVLEHIDLESSKKLLSGFIDGNKCNHIIVSIPYEYEQDEVYGNKYEKHLQPKVTYEYMKENFPYLKLIDSAIMTHNGGVIATYIWNRI